MKNRTGLALLLLSFTPILLSAQWINVPGTLTKISCASQTQVAGLDNSNKVYKYNVSNTSWDTIPASSLVQISINSNGTIWGIGPTINPTSNSNVYSYKNNTWTLPNNGANLSKICMIGDSFGYGINPNMTNNVYEYHGVNWAVLPGNGALKNITIGKDSSLWGIGPSTNPTSNSNVYKYNASQHIWIIPNNNINLEKIVVADSLRIIGIDNNGVLYKRTNNTWSIVSSLNNVKDISIAFDGTIYALTNASSGNIYKSTWPTIHSTVGLPEAGDLDQLTAYPNPASSSIHLSHSTSIQSVELYNIHGLRIKVNASDYSAIDLSECPDGVYFLKIITTNGQSKTVKFNKI